MWKHAVARNSWRRLLSAFSPYRTLEYPLVWKKLALKKTDVLLDVGPSFDFATFAAEEAGKVYGIDVNDHGIGARLEKYGRANIFFSLQDATRTGFRKNFFDKISLVSVIEHVPEDSLVLKEMERVLKPGGICVVSFPYAKKFKVENKAVFGGLQRYYDEKTIQTRLLKNTKMKLVEKTYFGGAKAAKLSETYFSLPRPLRFAFGWLFTLLALSIVRESSAEKAGENRGTCVLVLKKKA